MEILHRIRRLADLEIVTGGELQEALGPGAGVLRALTFMTMRQKQNDA